MDRWVILSTTKTVDNINQHLRLKAGKLGVLKGAEEDSPNTIPNFDAPYPLYRASTLDTLRCLVQAQSSAQSVLQISEHTPPAPLRLSDRKPRCSRTPICRTFSRLISNK